MPETFLERVTDGYGQSFDVEAVLYEQRTDHQHLLIFENGAFGRVMALDGIVQTTERDEFVYHEMLAHVPLLAHGRARRVLVVGGGDGGTLREVLRHPGVESATLVEIDAAVVDLCRRHLPGHSAGAFEDPRTRVVIGDGLAFVRETAERFDAILADSTDPVGPGESLFGAGFYAGCRRCLADDGVFAGHAGVAWFQTDAAVAMHARLAAVFERVRLYGAAVPTYAGGIMTFLMGEATAGPDAVDAATLAARYAAAGLDTRYYTPALHLGAFAMPRYVMQALESGRPPPAPQWDPAAHPAPER